MKHIRYLFLIFLLFAGCAAPPQSAAAVCPTGFVPAISGDDVSIPGADGSAVRISTDGTLASIVLDGIRVDVQNNTPPAGKETVLTYVHANAMHAVTVRNVGGGYCFWRQGTEAMPATVGTPMRTIDATWPTKIPEFIAVPMELQPSESGDAIELVMDGSLIIGKVLRPQPGMQTILDFSLLGDPYRIFVVNQSGHLFYKVEIPDGNQHGNLI